MATRLKQSTASAIEIATWLAARPEVASVLCPMLPGDPGHAVWTRDFTGGCGLFSFVLASDDPAASGRVADALDLFGIGYSWGGFESLVLPIYPHQYRSVMPPATLGPGGGPRPAIRLSIGLEDPADLIADLDQALARMETA